MEQAELGAVRALWAGREQGSWQLPQILFPQILLAQILLLLARRRAWDSLW